MTEQRRVVVTGLGIVSPLGTGVEKNWEALVAGRSGIRKIDRFPNIDAFASRIGGQVPDFRAEDYIEPKEIKKMEIKLNVSNLLNAKYRIYQDDNYDKSMNTDIDQQIKGYKTGQLISLSLAWKFAE